MPRRATSRKSRQEKPATTLETTVNLQAFADMLQQYEQQQLQQQLVYSGNN